MALVGFEAGADEFVQILSMNHAQIASRSYVQFNDISAKFSPTARVSGSMDVAGIGNIGKSVLPSLLSINRQ